MRSAPRSGRTPAAVFAAFVLSCGGLARAAGPVDDLASRFVTAPETAAEQQLLVRVELNGVDFGNQLIRVSRGGGITLPGATVRALRLKGRPGVPLEVSPASGIVARLDPSRTTLALTAPASMLAAQLFAPELDEASVHLSPETWGAYVNYDLNARHAFSHGGASAPGLGSWGGLADLRVLAPDMAGGFGWAYDGTQGVANGLARLDSTLTWRPASLAMAVSAGDVVSATTGSLAEARPYRFGGVQMGTDHSGVPGWSSSPIPSVSGTAQAQSAIDVYLDGQRTYRASTPGGPFSLVLPPGSTGVGANVVVTDVTGRAMVLPVDVPLADARVLRQGVLLWSAGLGAPRFGYGSARTSYDGQLYVYGQARYGLRDGVTALVHAEGGAGLAEAEAGADVSATRWLAVHASGAASRSARGAGGAGRLGVVVAGPWHLVLEAAAAHTLGPFDDVVSVSGREYGRRNGLDPIFSLPATSEMSARLSWQPDSRLSVSATYQSNTYQGSAPVGFASLSGSYLAGGRLPVFATLSHAMGGQHSTAIVAGVSFAFGGVQASVSAGYGMGSGGDRGVTGSITASRPLGDAVGDLGWDAYSTRSPSGTFANADAQIRTGYGIPGLAVQSFGGQVTGLATLRGSAGVVGLHPFASDPASGGLIIADAGRSGVPVQLNGYDKGRTSWDGKTALAGAVAGAPQRVAIDTTRLPMDTVPGETERLVVIRDGGASVASFGVRSASSSAILIVTVHGHAPPVGSTLVSAASSAPISKEGRAYLQSIGRNEVLRVDMPDGTSCLVHTRFDGRGGVGRRLGPLPCEGVPR